MNATTGDERFQGAASFLLGGDARQVTRRSTRGALGCLLALLLAGCTGKASPPGGVSADKSALDAPSAHEPDSAGGIDSADTGPSDANPDKPPDAAAPDLGTPAPDAATPPPTACVGPSAVAPQSLSLHDPLGTASVSIDTPEACLRTYHLKTTASLRDNLPQNPRTITELEGWPTARTGNALFDALYALALDEARQDAVATISNGAFHGGQPVSCGEGGCFETGRKWTYVWTRDTAYAAALGLAGIDPVRMRSSLDFKLSERRGGGDLQIVQDTGSGGSWPVSTDRVSWALGAWATLAQLQGPARAEFLARALLALTNTTALDREVAFDPQDGLYRGEQSFLDWREQSYPLWTEHNVTDIAMSKALSTNVLHLRALEITAALAAEVGKDGLAATRQAWANALRQAIHDRLWVPKDGQLASFVTTTLDPSPARRWDLLGSALAILSGVVTEPEAAQIVSGYPSYGPGTPVLWPQQPLVPIYHNRAEWPFVSAFWLRAAAQVGNARVADKMAKALMRGAALNLSNLENLEAETGASFVADGPASGPVVNSQRQLWSVAGYLSMVQHTLFGAHPEPAGLRVDPFVSRALRHELFPGSEQLTLNQLRFRGRRITLVLHLPNDTAAGPGAYRVSQRQLDGQATAESLIPTAKLSAESRLDIWLEVDPDAKTSTLTEISATDPKAVFAPRNPTIASVSAEAGGLRVTWAPVSGSATGDLAFAVLRDGHEVAADLPGQSLSWLDTSVDPSSGRGICYSVVAIYTASKNRSQHAKPECWWGPNYHLIQSVEAQVFQATGGELVNNHGHWHYQSWGDPGHSLTAAGFAPKTTGPYLFEALYGNGAGPVSTGITCGVKRLQIERQDTGEVVGQGTLVMPHLDTWDRWAMSTQVSVPLQAGLSYRARVQSSPDAPNMSVFEHFSTYTGGLGGADGPFNRVNIAAIRMLPYGAAPADP